MDRIAFLFPGQGSQLVGMGKDFFENFKESALVFEEASDAAHINLKKLCFDGPIDTLTLTENLQPALFTVETAMLAAIRAHAGIQPIVSAGHSLGEYAALNSIGALTINDGARLTRARGQAMQRAVPVGLGTMAAIIGIDSKLVEQLCRVAAQKSSEVVEPANYNAPGQVVIAGSVAGVEAALEIARTDEVYKGARGMPLNVSAPFHCSLMKPAQDTMRPLLTQIAFAKPCAPIIANVTAAPVSDETAFAKLLIEQITSPVRWEQSLPVLKTLEISRVIEVGPGRVLAGLIKRADRNMPVANIGTVDQLKEVLA